MVTRDRWEHAQDYEAEFWDSTAAEITSGRSAELEWYGWRADQLEKQLEALGLDQLTDGKSVVLEVGSGPVGVVSFFPSSAGYAVDPLQGFYTAQQALTSPRAEEVLYIQGVGESLSLADGTCDLVIIENCIDHVKSVQAVMNEISRVLRPGGILYLTVNCRTGAGYYVHRILSTLQIDPGHPHTFTPTGIRELIENHGYEIKWTNAESYVSATLADLRNGGLRGRVKALLGISEFTVSLIAVK